MQLSLDKERKNSRHNSSLIRLPNGYLARTAFVFLLSSMLTYTNAEANNGDNIDDDEKSELEELLNDRSLIPLKSIDAQNGSSNHSCTIIVTESGVLGSGFENMELSSKILNGRPGQAQVITTNGSFSLSTDPLLGFSAAPANGSSNVNMTSSFIGTGVTNFSETPGNISVRLRRGTTVVQAHMSATKTDNVPFPAGHYSATLTLRCE